MNVVEVSMDESMRMSVLVGRQRGVADGWASWERLMAHRWYIFSLCCGGCNAVGMFYIEEGG